MFNPQSNRRFGKPELRWLELVEEDLKKMDLRNLDREKWRAILEEAKVHQGQ